MARISSSSSATSSKGFDTLSPGYPTQVTVSPSASVQLLPANLSRKYAHITNNSGYAIYIQYGADAALNQGIKLSPGNTLFLSGDDMWFGVVNAIGLVSGQLIDVLEGI